MTETAREMLLFAAKAAGDSIWPSRRYGEDHFEYMFEDYDGCSYIWDPLGRDGDALRLAVRLGINVEFEGCKVVFADGNFSEFLADDPHEATRRAIVRAAAEIGKAMP